jgi:triosephosphate isomerase (TIM)
VKKRLVVANWKGYLEKPQEAAAFVSALRRRARVFKGVDVSLCAPYPFIPAISSALKGSLVRVGAQALSAQEGGAHTGEVSAAMLKVLGVMVVIVGHSERRALGENDASIHAQVLHAAKVGLTVVLCVGEKERDLSGAQFEFVQNQLASALADKVLPSNKLIVAYEPVWAIGKSTAEAATPAMAQEMVIFIRKMLTERFGREAATKVPVLYGGSVDPENATALLKEGGVSGFLVGRASAQIESFMELLKLCKV